jgi:hypothetical protein
MRERPNNALHADVIIPRFSGHQSLTKAEASNAEVRSTQEDESLQQ